jgi:hypothetical protein
VTKRIVLYHTTSEEAAASILRDGGFIDREGSYMTDTTLSGIFLSNRPLDSHEGAGPLEGDVILKVAVASTLNKLSKFELKEKDKTYREWCIPSAIINKTAVITRAQQENGPPTPSWESIGLKANIVKRRAIEYEE